MVRLSVFSSLVIAVVSAGVGGAITFFLRTPNIKSGYSEKMTDMPTMDSCILEAIKLTGGAHPDISVANALRTHCFLLIRDQQLLNDFLIRRGTFEEPFYAGNVLLWLVVCITCSGVLLAGIQIMTSYNLVKSGLVADISHEISFAKDRIALKSSIGGLAILAISLAFFFIFVQFIYKNYEYDVDCNRSNNSVDAPTTVSSKPQLGVGGMGPLPPKSPGRK